MDVFSSSSSQSMSTDGAGGALGIGAEGGGGAAAEPGVGREFIVELPVGSGGGGALVPARDGGGGGRLGMGGGTLRPRVVGWRLGAWRPSSVCCGVGPGAAPAPEGAPLR